MMAILLLKTISIKNCHHL